MDLAKAVVAMVMTLEETFRPKPKTQNSPKP